MPCKIKIKQNITKKIEMMTSDAFNMSLVNATKVAADVNKKFNDTVVTFSKTSTGKLDRSIYVPQSLVDTYYNHEQSIEKQELSKTFNSSMQDISNVGKLEGDLMQSEKGQIGVNKQQLLMLLGPTMYNKPLAQVAVKELLQNSFDAIKSIQNTQKVLDPLYSDKIQRTEQKLLLLAKQLEENENPLFEKEIKDRIEKGKEFLQSLINNKEYKEGSVKPGNIDINVNYDERTISIKDNGIGMTPEIVKNAFLSIGGTNKEGLDVSERSGGFGLAKVQFLLGSEYVKVVTIRDAIKTTLEASAIQLYNDDFEIFTESSNEPNGTFVEVKIPKSYTTPEGTVREIDFPGEYTTEPDSRFDILNKPLIGDVNVTFNWTKKNTLKNKILPIGINSNEKTLPPLFSKIDFKWGSADLYMSIEKKENPAHRILSSGIYQFSYNFILKDWENIPYDIVVNIKPSVSSTSEQYPFNNQREGFKNTIQADIKSLNNYLKKYALGEAEKDAKAVFSNITGLPKIDPNTVLTAEERAKLYEDVNKIIEENKRKRVDTTLEESQSRIKRIYKLQIDEKGVTDKDTGNVEVNSEKTYSSSFKAEKEIEKIDAIETINFNPALPQYHNNTNIDYLKTEGAAEFFSDFGSVVLDMVRFVGNELGYDYEILKSQDEKFFAGVSVDKTYGGVHVRKIINAIFVNPLSFDVSSLEEAVGLALHITIHEINHTTVSGEGASFTTALAVLYGKLYGTGKYGLFEGLFRSVYKKHFETFKLLKNEYNKSTTRNLSESFSGDKIKRNFIGDVQGNVNDVQTGQSSQEGYRRNQEADTTDKTGDVILNNIKSVNNKAAEASKKFLEALNFDIMFNAEQFLKTQAANKIKNSANLVSAVDVMQKFVAIASNKETIELPKQAAYIMYEMLGRKNKLSKDLWFNIEQWSGFQAIHDKYKYENLDDSIQDYMDLTPEEMGKITNELERGINPFAKKMAIVEFLHQTLITFNDLGVTPNTKRLSEDVTKEYFEKRGFRNVYEKNILIRLMNQILNWLNEKVFNNERFEKYDIDKLNDLALDIVDDIYKEDYIKFTRGFKMVGDKIITPEGKELVLKDYEESVNSDPVAMSIMNNILNNIYFNKDKSIGPKLSGSAATRKYGKTYRPVDEAFHDFDIVIPMSLHETEATYQEILKIVNDNITALTPELVRKQLLPLIQQQTWYKNFKALYPSFKITTAFVGRDHKKGESITVSGVIDGQFKKGKHIEKTGTVVDFFVRTKESEDNIEEFDNYWKTWKGIYEAKLKMGRLKDLVDFIYFDPFIKDVFKFTNKGYRYFSFAEPAAEIMEAEQVDSLELDVNSLNLTPEVVNYLYGQSSLRLSKEQFGIQAKEIISILQGSNLTNQEILEKIKCL